ncbi:MAG: site-2 protease family protein [Bdellovibrionaceae bacterium]|nr:site-2 protease family protein [Pseudobdellovibrionaceae bacterium]MDW8190763.1 site-2 protease family protein [Pseudobdellovibrionaceae bacterium]
MDVLELLKNFVGFFVILLFSLCFHEYAHGWMAKLKGDDTAERMGRLTLNPLAHLDPVGTVILPIIMIVLNSMGAHLPFFGWAKPVPVSVRNLAHPRKDMFWIALAGPISNIILAVIGTIVIGVLHRALITSTYYKAIMMLLAQFVLTNLFLAVFNLIPLNPLDGGRIVARFLPPQWAYKWDQMETLSSYLLLFLILVGGLSLLAKPVLLIFNWLMGFAEHGFF